MTRPRVVIAGGGFGGLAAAKALRKLPVDVILIDRRNYHLFQPLLYQVATAALSPGQIAQPIRAILRHQANATVLLDEITGIDKARKVVQGRQAGEIAYDTLILATGATHAYFGHDEWADVAPGLKTLDDATAIRRRILEAFEYAELATDAAIREAFLTFVVIGAGPTGVEMAGAIAELARHTLADDFRNIDPKSARVVLIEAGAGVLPAMTPDLAKAAQAGLERLGVDVRVNLPVTGCFPDRVEAGETTIPCRTIVWAAGVRASPVGVWLGGDVPLDRAGRVEVAADLSVPGHPDIFVIGDAARVLGPDGKQVPGIAPGAKQQGGYVASVIAARLDGRTLPAFRYVDRGNLATIGRGEAVVDLGWFRFKGFFAWLFWGLVHIFFLIDFRNRLSVMFDWTWSYFSFGRNVRLITSGASAPAPKPPAQPDAGA
ncbi:MULTISPECIES: NAD(P)/FAD-dependent oxidoreductase [unclassified Beijerinckia]|uniref:NAD(P)/FAD-dependent oxidoreductase n=1 Tax=unclassified Beijerinckia TaxID=2638183 RepID=UPI000899A555|nr:MULTISPECIES: NAD(P)/FAD-dependent oxidoreductase [unclassified Beijerinckia]MDH7795449.1 NADH dehydrogenase [Beijerinckia sp. GAS462]SEC02049.1 NADH dehydrogenase [Beijerinckia sp. 28-YEA-48]